MGRFTRVHGIDDLRRQLRQMPEDLKEGVIRELQDVAHATQKDAVAEAPYDDGAPDKYRTNGRGQRRGQAHIHVRDVIGVKPSRDKLRWSVGTSEKVIGKRLWRRAGWRSIFILYGTKGGRVKRGLFKGARIPPMAANNFLRRAFENQAPRYYHRVRAAGFMALRQADYRGIRFK